MHLHRYRFERRRVLLEARELVAGEHDVLAFSMAEDDDGDAPVLQRHLLDAVDRLLASVASRRGDPGSDRRGEHPLPVR